MLAVPVPSPLSLNVICTIVFPRAFQFYREDGDIRFLRKRRLHGVTVQKTVIVTC
jgi:hypothetical protein